ncbi:MAG: hypothetical protein ACM3VS_02115 [Candidatus Dadabacteria bacterium]
MSVDKNDRQKKEEKKNTLQPDQETLHKTDPQENMEGPFSSVMHKTGKVFETNETREEANRKRDENM